MLITYALRSIFIQAAEDALLRVYLTRQPPHLVQLPSSTFPDVLGDIYTAHGAESPYTPNMLGDAEIHYGSADRTGVLSLGARSRAAVEDADD